MLTSFTRRMFVRLAVFAMAMPAFAQIGSARINTALVDKRSSSMAQAVAQGASLAAAGSMPQIASGSGWDTALTLVNLSNSSAEALLEFRNNDGLAPLLPFTFPQTPEAAIAVAASFDKTLNPNSTFMLDTTGPASGTGMVGYASLLTAANVGGFAIFTYTPTNQQAVVPLETRNAPSYLLAFDDTGSIATGVAIANLGGNAANVNVVIRDDTGVALGTGTVSLKAQGHNSFMLSDPQYGLTVTSGKRGTLEFDTPKGGQISVLGIRANSGALTTLPSIASVSPGGGTFAHIAAGGGWQSTITVVNTGAAPAQIALNFYDDNGVPLALPLGFPQTGATATESSVTQQLAAGATLIVTTESPSTGAAITGSARLVTSGTVSGFAIFRYVPSGQEAVVPLETQTPAAFVLAFDNTGTLATGLALANTKSAAANIPVVVRDDAGNLLASASITLPASGHMQFMLADATTGFPATAGKRGTIEFDVPTGGQIAALGIRVQVSVITSVPVLCRAEVSSGGAVQPAVATLTTAVASSITRSSAQAGGRVVSDGGSAITERGIVWSAANNTPTLSDSKAVAAGSIGDYSTALANLTNSTTYYVRAYASNSVGTAYGAVRSFSTLNLPASVSPLITNQWMTFTWPYNAYYPVDTNPADSGTTNDGHVGNACGPTSLAKTLGYWKVSTGSGKIDANDDTLSGIHWTFDLSAMNVNYANVPASLARTATESQYRDTALLFEAAGAVGFTHGIGGGSPADTLYPAIAPYFNMSPAVHIKHDWEYTATDWTNLVEFELSKGRPIIVAGRTPGGNDPWTGGGANGHWWNVDGYNAQGQVHVTYNFWDNNGDPITGYFGVDSMGPVTFSNGQWPGYTRDHYAVFDFQPAVAPSATPVVETEPVNNPTQTTVRLEGAVLGEGNATVAGRGFHVEAVAGATTAPYDVGVRGGAGHFIATLAGLAPGATYHVNAYADTGAQRFNGDVEEFMTLDSDTLPVEVMPLLPNNWKVNTWPYNSGLPAYPDGPNGRFYNEQGATALARLLHYWRYPANGAGQLDWSMNWNGTPIELKSDLSKLNLNYSKMDYAFTDSSTADQYAETAKLIAATEAFGFGATGSGQGNLRSPDPDAYVAPNLVVAWKLDPGLTLVKQEDYTADQWVALLKSEIAAGRPILMIGRTPDSAAPGANANVNAGWFLVDGYNAAGQFHSDYGMGYYAFSVPEVKGWYDAVTLGPPSGYTTYHRALVGFKPMQ